VTDFKTNAAEDIAAGSRFNASQAIVTGGVRFDVGNAAPPERHDVGQVVSEEKTADRPSSVQHQYALTRRMQIVSSSRVTAQDVESFQRGLAESRVASAKCDEEGTGGDVESKRSNRGRAAKSKPKRQPVKEVLDPHEDETEQNSHEDETELSNIGVAPAGKAKAKAKRARAGKAKAKAPAGKYVKKTARDESSPCSGHPDPSTADGRITRSKVGGVKKRIYDDDESSSPESAGSSESYRSRAGSQAVSQSGEENVGPSAMSRFDDIAPLNPYHPVWSQDWHNHPPSLDMWTDFFRQRHGEDFVETNKKAIIATHRACFFNDPHFLGFGNRPDGSLIYPQHDGYLVSHSLGWGEDGVLLTNAGSAHSFILLCMFTCSNFSDICSV
jgi:hypothetical protein